MSLNVVKTRVNKDPQQVIELLEDMVRRAKEGEIESFVLVAIRASDRAFVTRVSGCKDKLAMAGALSFAQHDFLTGHND